MSTSVQDVLSLLPHIFPGEQQIPLGRIRPNPKNPGPPITEGEVSDMVETLEAGSLRNPIKVMPDPAKPLVDGVSPHPENPKLKADGQRWGSGDFNWVILAGELRYRVFDRMKREAIPAFILNPSPGEVGEITRADNAVRDRGWWAEYQHIEDLKETNSNLSQRQLAAKLKLDLPKVNRATGLIPLLNAEARSLIVSDANTQNKGNWRLSELAAAELAGLASDPVTPETQDLVRRALAAAIDHQMTQAKIKSLVQWVKAGNSPESYGASGKAVKKQSKGKQPEIPTSQTGPIGPAPRNDGKGQGQARLTPGPQAGGQGLAVPSQGVDGNGGTKEGSAPLTQDPPAKGNGAEIIQQQIAVVAAHHALGKSIQQVRNHIEMAIAGAFPRVVRLFGWTTGLIERFGIKHKGLSFFIALFILLWVGTSLISKAGRLMINLVVFHSLLAPRESQAPVSGAGGTVTVAGSAAPSDSVKTTSDKRNDSNGQSPSPSSHPSPLKGEGENQQGLAPGGGPSSLTQNQPKVQTSVDGDIQGASYSASSDGLDAVVRGPLGLKTNVNIPLGGTAGPKAHPKKADLESEVPDELVQRVKDDKDRAKRLRELLYSISYHSDVDEWRDGFKEFHLESDYSRQFDDKYFSDARLKKIMDDRIYYEVAPVAVTRLAKWSDTTDVIAVDGYVTERSDAVYPKKVLWQNRVTLLVSFFHNPDESWVVDGIEER